MPFRYTNFQKNLPTASLLFELCPPPLPPLKNPGNTNGGVYGYASFVLKGVKTNTTNVHACLKDICMSPHRNRTDAKFPRAH